MAQLSACDLSTFGEASVFEEVAPVGHHRRDRIELGRLEIDPSLAAGDVTVSYSYGFGGRSAAEFYDPRAATPDAFNA